MRPIDADAIQYSDIFYPKTIKPNRYEESRVITEKIPHIVSKTDIDAMPTVAVGSRKTYSFAEICKKIEKWKMYDFSRPLQMRYHCIGPDGQEEFIGYCVVGKENGCYKELFIDDAEHGFYHDGEYYGANAHDIFMWNFRPERGVENAILTVYKECEWIEG